MSEKNKKSRITKRKKRKLLFLICFVFVALGTITGLSFTVFFPVKNIEVLGNSIYTADEIIAVSGITNKDNLLVLNSDDILCKIQEQLPYVKSIEIEKKFPNTAVLTVKETDMFFALKNGNTVVYTDFDLRIVPKDDNITDKSITLIFDWEKDKTGKNILPKNSSDYDLIQQILGTCMGENLTVNLIDISKESSLNIVIDNRFVADLGNRYELEGKLSQLTVMVQEIDTEKTGKINLSSWSASNTRGYFIESDISDYKQ